MQSKIGTYLEDLLDRIQGLPDKVKRNMTLIKELDENYNNGLKDISAFHKSYVDNVRERVKAHGAAEFQPDTDALRHISELHEKTLQLADEKVALAEQIYDLVDMHIRRLDEDMSSFEKQLRSTGEFDDSRIIDRKTQEVSVADDAAFAAGIAASLNAAPAAGVPSAAAAAALRTSNSAVKRNKQQKRPAAVLTPQPMQFAIDEAAIDPNEPIYCICKRVSFGEMVGCDDKSCEIEWFHFGCVGLTEQPKGKWFCPACREKRLNKKKH